MIAIKYIYLHGSLRSYSTSSRTVLPDVRNTVSISSCVKLATLIPPTAINRSPTCNYNKLIIIYPSVIIHLPDRIDELYYPVVDMKQLEHIYDQNRLK